MKKKPFKRILCVLIAAVMLGSVFASTAAAAAKCACGHSPVVMISGFGATVLAEKQEDGSLKRVFPPDTKEILKLLGVNAPDLITGIIKLIAQKGTDGIEKPMREIITSIVEPLRMNDDGTSFYDIVPILSSAKDTSLEAFTKNGQLDLVPYTGSEFLDMEVIGDEIGDDHVFNFLYDWRLSHADVAAQLHDYLAEVCASRDTTRSAYTVSARAACCWACICTNILTTTTLTALYLTLRFSRAATSSPTSIPTSPSHSILTPRSIF